MPLPTEGIDLAFQLRDAVAYAATVGLELRLARAASADAACKPRERRILTDHKTWQKIFELRKLDLQFAFAALCTLRKNVENELRAIDYFEFGGIAQRTHLSRREFRVEDQ